MSGLERAIRLCRRHLAAVFALVVATTIGAGWAASDLEIDSDLKRLLPTSAPSVVSMQRLQEVYGGRIGRLTVVLEGAELATLKRTARRLAPRLDRLEGIDRVEYRRPAAFLSRYRLLYADLDDLETVRQQIERRVQWEKRRANPLFVDVSGDDPPALDFDDLLGEGEHFRGSNYYVGDKGERLVVFLHPTFSANDLARSKELVDRVDRVVADRLADTKEGVDYGLTGRYKKRVDLQGLLTEDLRVATALAAGLIAALLWLALGSPTGVLVVVLPLVVGIVWTAAWAEFAFDSLNILTGFLGAVLLGLGVDYGLHLYLRYHAHYDGTNVEDALDETLRSSGRANLLAGVTTMVPMATLLVSDFQAFYEFGAIAVGGLAAILAAYALLFPASMLLLARFGITLRTPLVEVATSRFDSREGAGEMRRRLRTWAIGAAVVLALLGAVAIPGATHLQFVRDFHVLQSTNAPSWHLDRMVNDILGRSQTPAVVPTHSASHSRRVEAALERRKQRHPHGDAIDEILWVHDLVPARQSAKVELLDAIEATLDDMPRSARTDTTARHRAELTRALDVAPIEVGDLPRNLRAPFERLDTPDASVVLVFPNVDLTDMEAVEAFVDVLRDLPDVEHDGGYDALSEATLLYDVIRYVERDARWMLVLTVLGLFVVSLLAFRRLRDTLTQFGLLGFAIACVLGWLGALGLHFNFLNVIILPIWLGLGIDATFHMLFELRDRPHALRLHATTAFAIASAFLTTLVGFGAMGIARHEGLASLGAVATWGLGLLMVVHLSGYLLLVYRALPESTSDAPSSTGDEEN